MPTVLRNVKLRTSTNLDVLTPTLLWFYHLQANLNRSARDVAAATVGGETEVVDPCRQVPGSGTQGSQ